jgi:spore maturation protein CgeB
VVPVLLAASPYGSVSPSRADTTSVLRIFVLDTYYPAFLDSHYARHPELAMQPYDRQLGSLMDESFGTSDAYSRNLRELGHEAVEVIANCEPLQLAWARERGSSMRLLRRLSTTPSRTARRVAKRMLLRRVTQAQIDEFDPDVVYVQDVRFFTAGDLDAVRRSKRLLVGQIASPAPTDRLLGRFDLLVSSVPTFVERFRGLGVEAEYLRLGFDERVLDRLERRVRANAEARGHDVTFVGGLDPAVHPVRSLMLSRIAPELDVDVWGYGIDAVPENAPHRRWYRGNAWGLDMYEILARSMITLNGHEDVADGYAANMRLFEATGVCTMLLTDERHDLSRFFEPGREVVTYADTDELVEKARFYLQHDDERQAIAAAGQARTLREHTYRERIGELASMLEARLVAR